MHVLTDVSNCGKSFGWKSGNRESQTRGFFLLLNSFIFTEQEKLKLSQYTTYQLFCFIYILCSKAINNYLLNGKNCWISLLSSHHFPALLIVMFKKYEYEHSLMAFPVHTAVYTRPKEIQIILRLFLVIAVYCQASSSQFNQSLNLPHCQLAGKETQVHAVGSNSLETTYILFELP